MRNNGALCEYIVSEGYFKKVNNDMVFKGKKFRYFKTFEQAFEHYTNLKTCFDNGRYYHNPKDNHFTGNYIGTPHI